MRPRISIRGLLGSWSVCHAFVEVEIKGSPRDEATLKEVFFPSVRPSINPSIRPSVRGAFALLPSYAVYTALFVQKSVGKSVRLSVNLTINEFA